MIEDIADTKLESTVWRWKKKRLERKWWRLEKISEFRWEQPPPSSLIPSFSSSISRTRQSAISVSSKFVVGHGGHRPVVLHPSHFPSPFLSNLSLSTSPQHCRPQFAATAEPSSETPALAAYLQFPSSRVYRRVGLVQPPPRLSSLYLAIAHCRAFFLSCDSSATVTSVPPSLLTVSLFSAFTTATQGSAIAVQPLHGRLGSEQSSPVLLS
ncbi:hypothetical protein AAHA92_31325 [Salvia divinorum]|uniref:Uncharacterized protein n=1 Tax=Salvia divinorum TaxID=28513 RepID=A0ABD1FTT2_SALDI